jgi:hypothetical protein
LPSARVVASRDLLPLFAVRLCDLR